MAAPKSTPANKPTRGIVEERDEATIRFAGDVGDGMQLVGAQFTTASEIHGNAVCTLPDNPAEIRAPAGSLAGVSGFQVHFGKFAIHTPGDQLNTLVVMNPAALKANLRDLETNGHLIVNADAFTKDELEKAGYTANPLQDDSLKSYRVLAVPMNEQNLAAVARVNLSPREAERCKNFFALGLVFWLYERPLEPTLHWIHDTYAKNPAMIEANTRTLKAGYHFGETCPALPIHYRVAKAEIPPGRYRNITGFEAMTLGILTAAHQSKLPLVFASFPLAPANEILHQLCERKQPNVKVIQAEDDLAAINLALGASFGGAIGVTATTGQGLTLQSETLGLAVMSELPCVVIDVQRAGPSTGMPSKTEQADLSLALNGRHGESPLIVLAVASPSDGFATVLEAVRLAIRYMTPVIVLADAFLANSAEPWRIPGLDELPVIEVSQAAPTAGTVPYLPYQRDERLARPWATPGTPGLEHRTGGLEKENLTGNVNYDPLNHEAMVQARARKIANAADEIPPLVVHGPPQGDLLVLGWGSTFGVITTAVERCQRKGLSVASVHLRHLNPLPKNLGEVMKQYRKILVPELNAGQLCKVLRSTYLIDAVSLSKIQGTPFLVQEIERKIEDMLRSAGASEQEKTPMSATVLPLLTPNDFSSDREVRWCPGCGDFSILSQLKKVLAVLNVPRENMAFISGLGCAGRLPYYLSTYGFHGSYGRAPALATGLKLANPKLQVWVVTGDGDALSAGATHLIHALRRNVDLKILLFNNEVLGVTKGQASPTARTGTRTKTSPEGSFETPMRAISLALAAEATFVARTIDVDVNHMSEVLEKAAAHQGAAFVEIYQNCKIFNDGVFEYATDASMKADTVIYLEHGRPLLFGKDRNQGLRLNGFEPEAVTLGHGITMDDILIHDEKASEPTLAFLLSRLVGPHFPECLGVFRSVQRPTHQQLLDESFQQGDPPRPLATLLAGDESWVVA